MLSGREQMLSGREQMLSGREQSLLEACGAVGYKGHMQSDLNYSIRISSFIQHIAVMGRRCPRRAMWLCPEFDGKSSCPIKGKNLCRNFKGKFMKLFCNWLGRGKGKSIKFLPYKGQESLPSKVKFIIFCPSMALPAHYGNRLYYSVRDPFTVT